MKTMDVDIGELRAWVERHLGLSFPEPRTSDLLRGMRAAAGEFGYASVAELWRALVRGAKEPLDAVTRHLTVGETYFFREPRAFDFLEHEILPKLIAMRRGAGRFLRIWSAACSTGEEPYSIAITLSRVIPDLADWNVSLLATDANPRALEFARRARFRPWSFRGTSAKLRATYFEPISDRELQLRPGIRKMVRFSQLNLAEVKYPPRFAGHESFDVIFCRNVLLYFTPAAAAAVQDRLALAIAEGGWLVSGVTDHIHARPPLVQLPLNGTAVFQKQSSQPGLSPSTLPISLAAKRRTDSIPEPPPAKTRTVPTARQLADEGNLDEALAKCEREIASDRLNPAHHYLHAIIAIEKGEWREAEKSLRRALFLDPEFVLAHYTLGTLAQRNGQAELGRKHLANASRLLGRYDSEDVLPESDGLSAGRLAQIIEQSLATPDDHQR